MIPVIDSPEVIHGNEPIRRIDMSEMDKEAIDFMLKNSRDDFYSNKELAPVREYSTNARDAHIQSGQPDRPIEVTLPSQLSPELRIRDFGNGLTIDELSDVYFRYWKSTKRGTNTQNGCLGIGAKSAFAYAPSYTVVSWSGGMKVVATGQKNGFADVIYHAPNTQGEPDGVEIVIPIQQKDISKFVREALEFFKYWDVRPIFHNVEEDTLKEAFNIMNTAPFLSGEGWAVRPAGYGSSESKAIMGFVPYNIDWDQVRNSLEPQVAHKVEGIFAFLRENLTALYFPNGTLAFTPNRESLQYNEVTVKALGDKLVGIYNTLLSLITSKIADAPNIWEAKIRYNQIFRKELDGFDKANLYGGNLNTLESILRNRVQWNGIIIANGYFEGLDKWDKTQGKVDNQYGRADGFEGIFETYVKDDAKIGVKAIARGGRRRRYSYESKIICSPRSIVIIQDTDKESLAKGLARWFLYKANKDIQQVYVLNLSDPGVKADFINHYTFDTVPVTYVSHNLLLIKAYLKSIRAPRSIGGSAPRESRPLNCPFMEIKNRRSHTYVSDGSWDYETVNARGIDGGGFYVVYSKESFEFKGRNLLHDESRNFWQAVYELASLSGEDLPKVYGIHPKTADSVWFKEAIEDGSWTNLADWITENIDNLPKDTLKKISAYLSATENRIGTIASEILSPLLVDNNGVAAKYFKEIADFSQYWNLRDIPNVFRLTDCGHEEAEGERFEKLNAEFRAKYPLVFKLNNSDTSLTNCDPNDTYHKMSAETAKDVAAYINLVDCYGA
jgi:hypothetical protein